jgi:hypothetical protein
MARCCPRTRHCPFESLQAYLDATRAPYGGIHGDHIEIKMRSTNEYSSRIHSSTLFCDRVVASPMVRVGVGVGAISQCDGVLPKEILDVWMYYVRRRLLVVMFV